MRDLAAETVRFLLGVALIVLMAMAVLKPAPTTLLIDAAMPNDSFCDVPLRRQTQPPLLSPKRPGIPTARELT